jgi:hypothetical protein
MKILLQTAEYDFIYLPLAREIGLYESKMLLDIAKALDNTGVKKDGLLMIARNDKQLKEMFPYCRNIALIRKILEKLQSQGYLYISQNTLFDPECLWYGLNEKKLRELRSITILSKEEDHDAHIPSTQIQLSNNGNGHEESRIFQILKDAFIKACHWDKSLNLTSRDWAEVSTEVKALIKKYPDHEIENLRLMVLGIDTYRRDVLKQAQPYRPSGISRAWGPYSTWCEKFNGRKPPEIPKEWL